MSTSKSKLSVQTLVRCAMIAAVYTVIHKIEIKVVQINKILPVILKGIDCKLACA